MLRSKRVQKFDKAWKIGFIVGVIIGLPIALLAHLTIFPNFIASTIASIFIPIDSAEYLSTYNNFFILYLPVSTMLWGLIGASISYTKSAKSHWCKRSLILFLIIILFLTSLSFIYAILWDSSGFFQVSSARIYNPDFNIPLSVIPSYSGWYYPAHPGGGVGWYLRWRDTTEGKTYEISTLAPDTSTIAYGEEGRIKFLTKWSRITVLAFDEPSEEEFKAVLKSLVKDYEIKKLIDEYKNYGEGNCLWSDDYGVLQKVGGKRVGLIICLGARSGTPHTGAILIEAYAH